MGNRFHILMSWLRAIYTCTQVLLNVWQLGNPLTGSSGLLSLCTQHLLPRHSSSSSGSQTLAICASCLLSSSPRLEGHQKRLWVWPLSGYQAVTPINGYNQLKGKTQIHVEVMCMINNWCKTIHVNQLTSFFLFSPHKNKVFKLNLETLWHTSHCVSKKC